MKRSPYEILQCDPEDTIEAIKRSHRKLSKELHPDNKETGDREKFEEVDKAWQLLKDPERRQRYDDTGSWNEAFNPSEKEINATLLQVFTSVFNGDDMPTDPRVVMETMIKHSTRSLKQQLKDQQNSLWKTARWRKRIKDENLFSKFLDDKISSIESDIEKTQNAIEISVAAQKRVWDFKFEADPQSEGQYNRGSTTQELLSMPPSGYLSGRRRR